MSAIKVSRASSYAILGGLTVLLGLATRRYPHAFPAFIATYGGDALWAALVYWLLAILFLRMRPVVLAFATIAISFAVEISQLYHPQWLDAARSSGVGALVLGHGFVWSDLVCYVFGASGAALVDSLVVRRLYTARR